MHNYDENKIKKLLIFAFLFFVVIALTSITVVAQSSELRTHITSKKANIDIIQKFKIQKYKNDKLVSDKFKIKSKKKTYKIKTVEYVAVYYHKVNGKMTKSIYKKTYNGKGKTKLILNTPVSKLKELNASFIKLIIKYDVGKKTVKETIPYKKLKNSIYYVFDSNSAFKGYFIEKAHIKDVGNIGIMVPDSAVYKLVGKKKNIKIKKVKLYFYNNKNHKLISKTYKGNKKSSMKIKLLSKNLLKNYTYDHFTAYY